MNPNGIGCWKVMNEFQEIKGPEAIRQLNSK
jgi:hypothetical protein